MINFARWTLMMRTRRAATALMIVLSLLCARSAASAQNTGLPSLPGARPQQPTFGDSRDKVTVTIIPAQTRVAPGSDLIVAVILDHEHGWHTHTNDPKVPKELGEPDDYYKTQIALDVPPDSPLTPHAGFIQWPTPHTVNVAFGTKPVDYEVFEGKAIAYLPVTIAADAKPGIASLRIKPAFQACDDNSCAGPTPYPPREPGKVPDSDWLSYGYDLTIEIVDPAALAAGTTPTDPAVFKDFDPSVWSKIHSGVKPAQLLTFDLFGWSFKIDVNGPFGLVLLLLIAALGGFLLNLTPCVLPVIPLKIMSLAAGGKNRGRTLALGVAMFLGVIALWMALGAVIATVSGFTATNQLFQYPFFAITVGLFIALMAIGMCGLFTVRLPQFVYFYNPSHDTYHGSFMFGIMTAILSTPCTAPFMGAAAAWAATQSPTITLSVFFAIGFGMGLPYFILSAFPDLVKKMPRTGPASELIKQVMGLLMLAAAAYFIGVGLSGMLVSPPEPPSRAYLWLVAALVAAAGGWLLWRTLRIARSPINKTVFSGLGLLVVGFAIWGGFAFTDKGPIDWTYYTPQRLAEAQHERKVIVMEFTAEWCLNCKALEKTVLSHPDVAKLLAEHDVEPIKIDLTGNNADGNNMLTKVGRRSIPLLVVFAPDGTETFKSDFYTVNQVLDAVRAARSNGNAVPVARR